MLEGSGALAILDSNDAMRRKSPPTGVSLRDSSAGNLFI